MGVGELTCVYTNKQYIYWVGMVQENPPIWNSMDHSEGAFGEKYATNASGSVKSLALWNLGNYRISQS